MCLHCEYIPLQLSGPELPQSGESMAGRRSVGTGPTNHVEMTLRQIHCITRCAPLRSTSGFCWLVLQGPSGILALVILVIPLGARPCRAGVS